MAAVRFTAFADAEFERYRDETIPEYAAEHVRAGTYPAEGSVDRARAEFATILPQGTQTPGHTFVWIDDAESGARVGHLWYYLPPGQARMFIYDILVRPEHRRHGYAEAALTEAERIGRREGARTLALHVFGFNTGAIALYEKLGYATTNRMMAKPL
ncbi:MAG: GNAT family N-acetyltransferase [Thermoplasmata archaeon]|nr:GNAT family N-acetyltransferase [Thermoplasmata archaeon]